MNPTENKILVTGGTGFFGCSLLDMIAAGNWRDCRFILLSRRAESFALSHPEYTTLENVEFISGDVRALSKLDAGFDYIIHAATPAVDTPDDAELRDIIIAGTESVLAFAKRCNVKKLLYISSGGVYGSGTKPFSEKTPCQPHTVYGKAKLTAEKLVLDSGIPSVVMRAFTFAGKHLRRDVHFAFGNFIADALAQRDIVIKGDGTPLRSYMHSDDLARWMMIMLFEGRAGKVYNCGSPEAVSIKALAERINMLLHSSGKIRVLSTPVPGAPVSSYVPDVKLAENELGLSLQVSLEEAIKRSV